MGLLDVLRTGLARQLSRPEGFRGRLVARELNKGNRNAIEAAVGASGVGAGQVAADVGFGGGLGLDLLLSRVGPSGHVHGVELSDTMLASARRRHQGDVEQDRLTLAKGTLEQLPIADGQVDGLITVNTVYFVDDLGAVFGEIARVLSPGGRAVIGVADPDWMTTQPVVTAGAVFRIRPVAELVAALRGAGLEVREDQLDDVRRFRLLVATRKPIEGPE